MSIMYVVFRTERQGDTETVGFFSSEQDAMEYVDERNDYFKGCYEYYYEKTEELEDD